MRCLHQLHLRLLKDQSEDQSDDQDLKHYKAHDKKDADWNKTIFAAYMYLNAKIQMILFDVLHRRHVQKNWVTHRE